MVLILGDVSNLISAYVQPLKDAESSARTTSTSVGIRWDKTVLFRFVWFVFKRKKKNCLFCWKTNTGGKGLRSEADDGLPAPL